MTNTLNDRFLQAAINEDIHIVPYDAAWPKKFLDEKTRLLAIFSSDFIEIEHIGSTAVVGLAAKPIIDLLASVKSMQVADTLLVPLRQFNYVTPPECNAGLHERRWLMRQMGGHRTHHLHLVRHGSDGWKRTIKFRDILRADRAVAQAYQELKFKLAKSVGSDRVKYIQGKTEFVEDLLKRF